MAEKTARIIFEAVDKASGTINTINEKVKVFEATTTSAKNTYSSLGNLLSNITPWVTLGASVGSTIAIIKESIFAWGKEEQSILKLQNAISLAYNDVDKANKYFENLAQRLQVLYGVSDTTGRQMIQLAIRFGAPTNEIERLVEVAINMSRAMGIDSQTAIEMLIRAGSGYTMFLRRMGIIIDENVVKQKGLTGVLDELEKKFAGLSDKYLNTLEGSFTNLKNTTDDLKEAIGKYITENSGLIVILQYTVYMLRLAQDETSGLGEVFKAVGWIIGAVGKFIILTIDTIITGFKELGTLVAGVVASIYFVIKRDFKNAGETIKQTFKDIQKTGNEWIDRMALLYTNNSTAFRNMTRSMIENSVEFNEKNKQTAESVEGLVERSEELRKELQKLKEQIEKYNINALAILKKHYDESKKSVEEFNLAFMQIKEPEIKLPENYKNELKGLIVYQDEIIHKTMQMSSMISDAFIDAITGTKTFEQALKDLITQIGIYIAKALIMTAITQALFTILGIKPGQVASTLGAESVGFGNMFMRLLLGGGYKEGGVVYGFRPVQFQEGGVVTRPTLAIVGEGGEPEYIIPRSKLPKTEINVVIHNATPKTYVEVFSSMDRKSLKIMREIFLNA